MAWAAQAVLPTLSISRVPPSNLQFSWPSNFSNWQLLSVSNLSSTNWHAVTPAPVPLSNLLVVQLPMTNTSGFFRLQQTNSGGGCVFQANPPMINSGASSLLTWCPVAGLTYRLTPGPGIVTGGSVSVSPTVTTIYTLTASNALGVVTNFTPVIVNPCGFASVTNWNATLTFTYNKTATAPGYSFSVNRSLNATFHLTGFENSGATAIFTFDGISGNASINDREDDTSGGDLVTSTTVGSGTPNPQLSVFLLSINCSDGTYNLSSIVGVDAIDTETSDGISSSSPRTAIAGQVTIFPRPLPTSGSTLSGSETVPVVGFSVPASDNYMPNDTIANDMWFYGAVTDATAGTASVSWSISPAP
ncbi:MAG TPA: hypothetical protein VG938_09075 [Verrucomicrobiae bacterium]|jgi:hypothetical protein|nr:hypothetical protein [Verrucomicrobiae bacterium]